MRSSLGCRVDAHATQATKLSPMNPSPLSPGLARRQWLFTGLTAGAALLLVGCAAPSARGPAHTQSARRPPQGPYNSVRNDMTVLALSLLDSPYVWGGRGPATGFDCSGLVAHVYREGGGMKVQGTAADLGRQSRPIDPQLLLPGDLVFFNTLGRRHSHVGIYVGDGRFVHASNPRTGVRLDRLSNGYYAQRFEGAHRLFD